MASFGSFARFASGRHLMAARRLAGLTQSELAKAAGLHRNAVSYWERKKGRIERSSAHELIASALEAHGVKVETSPEVTITLSARCSS